MMVRWLGNACIEINSGKHLLIDPNFVVPPERVADWVLVTHEHDDHYSEVNRLEFGTGAEVYAPRSTLDKFDLDGEAVSPGQQIDGIQVLESDCWNAVESVSYYYNGLLHCGDTAEFPEVHGDVGVVFSACFPDHYDDYVEAFKRLEPSLVVPFHYDPEENMEDARGLVEHLESEGFNARLLEIGEVLEI